jgi:hypothetical protein
VRYVCFAPKATELPRGNEMTLRATLRTHAAQQIIRPFVSEFGRDVDVVDDDPAGIGCVRAAD